MPFGQLLLHANCSTSSTICWQQFQSPSLPHTRCSTAVPCQDLKMGKRDGRKVSSLIGSMWVLIRKCFFSVLSFGPIPNHIAFIMDGNRRYAKSTSIKNRNIHSSGLAALLSVLQYCYEMGVKYVTVYAFSIDNFKRNPDEVQSLMDLMQEKIVELLREESIVNKYGIKINFWGNLNLLSQPVRLAAQKAMASTGGNTGPVLSVCVAYTSNYEMVHAIQESIMEKGNGRWKIHKNGYCNGSIIGDDKGTIVSVDDLENHLYTVDYPEPDILIRTSGETRLSNFLLWQTTYTHLQNPGVLWPKFSLIHLIWAILEYQKVHPYLEERKTTGNKKDYKHSSSCY